MWKNYRVTVTFPYENRIYFPISRKLTQKRSRYNTSYND